MGGRGDILDARDAKMVPLWSLTNWDKRFNTVEKHKQDVVIKYHYYLAAEADRLVVNGGDVKILTTYESDLWTSEDLVEGNVSSGEVVSIPWGGKPNVQYFKGRFITTDNRIATSKDTEVLDNRYLYCFMLAKTELIGSFYRGASLKHPEMGKVLDLKIPLPSLSVQKRIAAVLDKICELKKNAETRLVKLDTLVKSRFVEMFGDTRSNSKALPVRRLDGVCSSIVRGPFGSALKKEFFVVKGSNTYKVYEQKHAIQKNATIGTYYIDADRFSELRRFECRPGDIIMSCSGTMGEFFQLPVGCEQGVMNQALCKFSLSDAVLPVYFLNYMKNAIGLLRTQGSGIQNIAAVSYVKSMPFLLPSITLQREFAAFVERVDKLREAARQTVEAMDTLYRSKLQEYFG